MQLPRAEQLPRQTLLLPGRWQDAVEMSEVPGGCWGAGGCTGAMLKAGRGGMLVTSFSQIHGMLLPGMQGRACACCRDDRSLTRVSHVAERRPHSSHGWFTCCLLSPQAAR